MGDHDQISARDTQEMDALQNPDEEARLIARQDAGKKGLGKPSTGDEQTANETLRAYYKKQAHEFRLLEELCETGWQTREADSHFANLRHRADAANDGSKKGNAIANSIYDTMQAMGHEIHSATGAFSLSCPYPPNICDMCMAPGGFLRVALEHNPRARVTAFSLPVENGGHAVLLPWRRNCQVKMLDITMLAADMGATQIPADHPDRDNFLPQHFNASQAFDLVLCGGCVLRTHQRASYREAREVFRLRAAQLALGLEHLVAGGTMVVLLFGLASIHSAELIHRFSPFSSVQVFKPTAGHANRVSYYLVAKDIQAGSPQAVAAIREWKDLRKVATFGTEEEFENMVHRDRSSAEALLESYGEKLVEMGREV